jgi:hypothetical protein
LDYALEFCDVKLLVGQVLITENWPTISQTATKPRAMTEWKHSIGMDFVLSVVRNQFLRDYAHIIHASKGIDKRLEVNHK